MVFNASTKAQVERWQVRNSQTGFTIADQESQARQLTALGDIIRIRSDARQSSRKLLLFLQIYPTLWRLSGKNVRPPRRFKATALRLRCSSLHHKGKYVVPPSLNEKQSKATCLTSHNVFVREQRCAFFDRGGRRYDPIAGARSAFSQALQRRFRRFISNAGRGRRAKTTSSSRIGQVCDCLEAFCPLGYDSDWFSDHNLYAKRRCMGWYAFPSDVQCRTCHVSSLMRRHRLAPSDLD